MGGGVSSFSPEGDGSAKVHWTEHEKMPGIDDLRARLRFRPGRISLDDKRMALLHVRSLAALRRELVDSFGADAACGLLTRMGYASGSEDAETARTLGKERSFVDAFLSGPQMHMLEGIVVVEPLRVELDVEKGHYYGEFLWMDSIEVDCHLLHHGLSAEPVCWMQVGYASGYTTVFLGRPILYREVECRGAGAKNCRIVGRPVEAWEDALDDLRHFRPETFVNRAPRRDDLPIDLAPPPSGVKPEPTARHGTDEMVGLSSGFNAASHLLRKVADTDATVLFLGETGVGKELFARKLHAIGARAGGQFVAVNCAAIPENLVEAELFGVEKGAYTGAVASRPGRFERAHGGTLFLDEVGTLAHAAQAKLLRALQTGEIERVGSTQTREVSVRVVAATNEDLKRNVAEGRFRRDLFYRLNVFPIHVPPLRERRDDLPLLMRYFLDKFARRHRRHVTGFTERAIHALLDYDYPGNIRELENMIERAVILSADGSALDVHQLFSDSGMPRSRGLSIDDAGALRPARSPLEEQLSSAIKSEGIDIDALEAAALRMALDHAGGNRHHAAKSIGLTYRQLAYRLKAK